MTDPLERTEAPLIDVRAVCRTYSRSRLPLRRGTRTVHALRDLTMSVPEGERFGVVGESGCGKSTLLRLLSGLEAPSSGSIRVAGREIAGGSPRQMRLLRQQMQVVFQDPRSSLDPRMRVRDIIAEPLLEHSRAAARSMAGEMLEAVGLPPSAGDRYPHQFSGGERQRISIARALVSRPRVLLADEPVSALDVSVRAQILNLLADVVERYDLTLVFVSHDLSVVRWICDTVAVMNRGQLVEIGPVERVYRAPQANYTQALIAASPSLRSVLAAGPDDPVARSSDDADPEDLEVFR